MWSWGNSRLWHHRGLVYHAQYSCFVSLYVWSWVQSIS